jgi:hypothetical protein
MGVLARQIAEAWPRWIEPRSSWQAFAACVGHELGVFYPEAHESYAQARSICSACLVLEDCRRFVDAAERRLPASAIYGFFAGESPSERIRRRRS